MTTNEPYEFEFQAEAIDLGREIVVAVCMDEWQFSLPMADAEKMNSTLMRAVLDAKMIQKAKREGRKR